MDALGLRAGHTAEVAACIGLVLRLEALRVVGHAHFPPAVRAADLRPLRARAHCARRPPVFVPIHANGHRWVVNLGKDAKGVGRHEVEGGVEGVLLQVTGQASRCAVAG